MFIIQYGECKIKVKITNCEDTEFLTFFLGGVNGNGAEQLQ